MSNSNMSPIFPMPDPHHQFLTDYGFDPQFHYFQVLEEARKQKKERAAAPTAHQFKKKHSSSSRSKRWLKNAFRFIRGKLTHWPIHQNSQERDLDSRVYQVRAASSGPLYMTESRTQSATPYRTTTRSHSSSGQHFASKNKNIPYINLRELNMNQRPQILTTAPLPIYLVT